MAHSNTASRCSTAVEPAQRLRLVHTSGARAIKVSHSSASLILVAPQPALPHSSSSVSKYRRLLGLVHLLVPHMPIL